MAIIECWIAPPLADFEFNLVGLCGCVTGTTFRKTRTRKNPNAGGIFPASGSTSGEFVLLIF